MHEDLWSVVEFELKETNVFYIETSLVKFLAIILV